MLTLLVATQYNNAGIAGPKSPILAEKDKKSLEELTSEMFKEDQSFWNQTWQTNVEAYYFMTLAFLPLLEAFTFGKDPLGKAIYEKYQTGVIFTSSISGLIKQAQNHFACTSRPFLP
jgi:NAD(P)-dependent dehydrogenase (short-subunit alcohol dehydrogenase family)